jgi:4-amino-4-deoxy-L-arabinose transferase-like glycosyltransferase
MVVRPRAKRASASPSRPLSAGHEISAPSATPMEKVSRRFLVPILLLLFSVQAASSIATKSATWDETNYFGMGDYLLRNWRWDVPSAVIHPPLAYYLDSLPLLFADLDRRVWTYSPSTPRDLAFLRAADIERGQALLSSPANRGDRLLLLSRCMVILQALLLGYFVYRFGTRLYGWKAGLLALAFFAFCPNMIAHGALITPDMTLAVFFFVTIYYFRMALVSDDRKCHVLAGGSLGLALLSKFPALLLLPVEGVILAFLALRGQRIPVRWLLISWACALVVFLLGYGFNVTPYIQGIKVQQLHGPEGHWSFLMGQLSTKGWWYYCLVAFVLKTPIPLLLFLATALVFVGVRAIRLAVSTDDLVLWVPLVAVFAFFSVELRSIGLRYVLPVYPFAFVIASGAVLQLKRLRYLLIIPIIWYPVASWTIWPDYLAYFNEFVGGADNGYRYLVDSNLDWGQDLKGLKRFMDSRGIDRIYLSYFGTDSPARYGIHYDWLPSYSLKNAHPQATIDVKRKRYLAISVTNLQGVYMEPNTMFRWLDRYTPVARIGHSIFVYYLE